MALYEKMALFCMYFLKMKTLFCFFTLFAFYSTYKCQIYLPDPVFTQVEPLYIACSNEFLSFNE